jgi:hypothetical protein
MNTHFIYRYPISNNPSFGEYFLTIFIKLLSSPLQQLQGMSLHAKPQRKSPAADPAKRMPTMPIADFDSG